MKLGWRSKRLKDFGVSKYYIGGDFTRFKDTESPQYGELLKDHGESAPVEHRDHRERETSEFCGESGTALCQSLIGMLQWVVTQGK